MTSATGSTQLTEQDYAVLDLFVPVRRGSIYAPAAYHLDEVPTTDNVYTMIQRLQRIGLVEVVRVGLNAVDFKLSRLGKEVREAHRPTRVQPQPSLNWSDADEPTTYGLTPMQAQAIRTFTCTGEDDSRPGDWHCILFNSGHPDYVRAMNSLTVDGLVEEERHAGATILYRLTQAGLDMRFLLDRHRPATQQSIMPRSSLPEPTTNYPSVGRERRAFELFDYAPAWRTYDLIYERVQQETHAQMAMLVKDGYAELVERDQFLDTLHVRLTPAGEERRLLVLSGRATPLPNQREAPPPPPDAQPPQRRIKITKRNI